MKRFLTFILLFCLLLPVGVLAVDSSRSYSFKLSADKSSVSKEDTVTVTLTLHRTDKGSPDTMYAFQDEICYDSDYLQLVKDSLVTYKGVQTEDISIQGSERCLIVSYVSFTGGNSWSNEVQVCSFQMKAVADNGSSVLKSENCIVSLRDGSDSYAVTVQNLTLSFLPVHVHTLSATEAKAVTCTKNGNIRYYTCSECGKKYSDEAATDEVTSEDIILSAGHKLELVQEQVATPSMAGSHAYYICTRCHTAFKDAEGATVTTAENEAIPRIVEIEVNKEQSGNVSVDETTVNTVLDKLAKQIGSAGASTDTVEEMLKDFVSSKDRETISTAVADAINNQTGINIVINLEQIEEKELTKTEKEILFQNVPNDKNSTVEAYLDLSVELQTTTGTLGNLTQLPKAISFTVQLDKEIAQTNTTGGNVKTKIFVGRIHEGEMELIPATLKERTLTFETDCFSIFTVVVITYLNGDINNDGKFNTLDLVRLAKFLSGDNVSINAAAADANTSSGIDLLDLARIMKMLSGNC